MTGLPGTFVFRRDDGDGKDVFLMQPDRSGLVQLTTDPKLDSAPMLSPDGTRVAFERTDPDAGNADIWIVNADGTNEIPITQTDQVEDWPSWSPDGTRLLFTRTSLQDTVETSEIANLLDCSDMYSCLRRPPTLFGFPAQDAIGRTCDERNLEHACADMRKPAQAMNAETHTKSGSAGHIVRTITAKPLLGRNADTIRRSHKGRGKPAKCAGLRG